MGSNNVAIYRHIVKTDVLTETSKLSALCSLAFAAAAGGALEVNGLKTNKIVVVQSQLD